MSARDHREALAGELGIADPQAIAALSAAQAAALLETVREARQAQQATLDRAIDDAMEHVPWLLRGALRKILF